MRITILALAALLAGCMSDTSPFPVLASQSATGLTVVARGQLDPTSVAVTHVEVSLAPGAPPGSLAIHGVEAHLFEDLDGDRLFTVGVDRSLQRLPASGSPGAVWMFGSLAGGFTTGIPCLETEARLASGATLTQVLPLAR